MLVMCRIMGFNDPILYLLFLSIIHLFIYFYIFLSALFNLLNRFFFISFLFILFLLHLFYSFISFLWRHCNKKNWNSFWWVVFFLPVWYFESYTVKAFLSLRFGRFLVLRVRCANLNRFNFIGYDPTKVPRCRWRGLKACSYLKGASTKENSH